MAMFFAWGSIAWAQPETYRVVSDESRFEVHVGRAGLFKMFGHDHVVRVGSFEGTVTPSYARKAIDFLATSLPSG